MRGVRTFLRGLVMMSLSACTTRPLTEVVVQIVAEPQVRAESSQLSLRIYADPDGARELLHDDTLPFVDGQYTLALSPENPALAGRYLIEASAREGTRVVASARLESGYVPRQTRHVTLLLEDACIGAPSCPADGTCHQGVCGESSVEPSNLSEHEQAGPISVNLPAPVTAPEPDAGRPDARVSPAATTDAGAAPQPVVGEAGIDRDAAPPAPLPPHDASAAAACSVPRGTYLLTFESVMSNCDLSVDDSTITQLYVLDGTPESLLETTSDCQPGSATRAPDGCEVTLRQVCAAPNPFGTSAGNETFLISLRLDDPEHITGTQIAEVENHLTGAMCRVVMKVTGVPQ
jgi:hypothetical protein